LIEGLLAIPGLQFFGITDQGDWRALLDSFVSPGERHADRCRDFFGDRGIFTWDGNFYALNLTERLGVEELGGVLRVGLVHYNTPMKSTACSQR